VVFLARAAERAAAVAVGRAVFGLPYRWARMGLRRVGGRRAYAARLLRPGPPVRSRVAVSPVGPSIDGDLERFLTARWGLHVAHLGRTWYLPNTHVTWPLRRAEVHELDDGLLAAAGLGDLARRPPDHVALSEGVAATFGRPVLASTPRPDRTAPTGSGAVTDRHGRGCGGTGAPRRALLRPDADGRPIGSTAARPDR